MKIRPEHVKGARGMLGLSQAELADAAGVSENTIRFFESGKNIPKEDTLWRIQAALERMGIEFMNGDSPGVRLRPEKTITLN